MAIPKFSPLLLKTYIFKFGWLLLERVVKLVVGFLLSILVARHFGPEKLGLYNYALSIVTFFYPIAVFSTDSLLIRDLVKNPEHESEVISSVFFLRIISSLCAIVFVLVSVFIVDSKNHDLFIISLIVSISFLSNAFFVLDCWFQSRIETKYPSISRISAYILSAFIKVIIVIFDFNIVYLPLSVLLDSVICSFGYWYYFRTEFKKKIYFLHAKYRIIMRYLAEAKSLVLTSLVICVYMKVDRFILGTIVDNYAVGIYSLATQLCELFYIFPMMLTSLIYPKLIELHGKSTNKYEEKLKDFIAIFFYISLIVSLVVFYISDDVVIWCFGEKYLETVYVLKVYIFTLPVVSYSAIFSHWYILYNKTKISFYGTLFGGVSAIILNMFLIKQFGLIGCAFASLISMSLPTIFIAFLFERKVGFLVLDALTFRKLSFYLG